MPVTGGDYYWTRTILKLDGPFDGGKDWGHHLTGTSWKHVLSVVLLVAVSFLNFFCGDKKKNNNSC